MADAVVLETVMLLRLAASDVVKTIESVEDNGEAEELELALTLEADTKMIVRAPTRLADVVDVAIVVVGLEG